MSKEENPIVPYKIGTKCVTLVECQHYKRFTECIVTSNLEEYYKIIIPPESIKIKAYKTSLEDHIYQHHELMPIDDWKEDEDDQELLKLKRKGPKSVEQYESEKWWNEYKHRFEKLLKEMLK